MEQKPVRVNTQISARANEWLDKRSRETAVSKSALINMAIEQYMKESQVLEFMPAFTDKFLNAKIDMKKMEKLISRLG